MALPPLTKDTGVFSFQLAAESGWATDSKDYWFGPYGDGQSLSVSATKNPVGVLSVRVMLGELGHTFSISLPQVADDTLKIVLIWDQGWVALQVNDKTLSSARLKPAAH